MKELIKKIIPQPLWQLLVNFKRFILRSRTISGNYRIIPDPDISKLKKEYDNAWKDKKLPTRQKEYLPANPLSLSPFKELTAALSQIDDRNHRKSILEVGCSGGYHVKVIRESGLNMSYEGCDYSEAFIEEAKNDFPETRFCVADATKLPYEDESFDIVISGCCILHIAEYEKAISESARVATEYVIFHRTPIIIKNKTSFFEKTGYGLRMLEILFNESELYELFEKYGLELMEVFPISEKYMSDLKESVQTKTYLCRKT